MTEQLPQPNPQTIVAIQKQELERANDNRVYLMAVMEEMQAEAVAEIQRLNDVITELQPTPPEG